MLIVNKVYDQIINHKIIIDLECVSPTLSRPLVDIFTCDSRKNTGVQDKMNGG